VTHLTQAQRPYRAVADRARPCADQI